MTSTFPTAEERKATGYKVVASPTLNPGQTVRAKLTANRRSVRVGVRLDSFRDCDESFTLPVEYVSIAGGQTLEISAAVPELDGYPVHRVGIALEGEAGDDVLVHWLTWEGTPKVQLARCPNGESWRDAWVAGVDDFQTWTNPPAAVKTQEPES